MSGETKRATLRWTEGLAFRGGEGGGPEMVIDGDNAGAPGPMLTLLLAAGACSGADVVLILRKMRIPPRELRIELTGERREQDPRRYTAIHFHYHVAGEGVDEARAGRAVELSIARYCSVIHSLAPDIRITHELTLG
ncbi:MAG TPA: OsmC family protein [Gemmatimonadales bacterium]|nr:OsmC family protein [Gemmatimonadales bacterium]